MSTQTDTDHIRHLANALDATAEQMRREIAELERLGVHDATYYYRDGRYLYVNWYCDQTGRRMRSYIGTDPERCQRAIADIERFRQRRQLQEQLRTLDERRSQLNWELQWLRSRYQELAKEMVTGRADQVGASVTSQREGQTDWVAGENW